MKSQRFSGEQLRDLVSGKIVTTVEAKKKGEKLTYTELPKPSARNGWSDYSKAEISNAIKANFVGVADSRRKKVCELGDVVRACNEKGEDMVNHYEHLKQLSAIANYQKPYEPKPLLVRLEKIEESRSENVYVFGSKKPAYKIKACWLKSWRIEK